MEAIKIYLIGGRIIEISEDDYKELITFLRIIRDFNKVVEIMDISGSLHHFLSDKIIEIVKPK